MKRILSTAIAALAFALPTVAADPIKVLIVDGQNNHNWRGTTPILRKTLEDTKLFKVDVATTPSKPGGPQKPKDFATNDQAKKVYAEALAAFEEANAKYKKEMAVWRPTFSDYAVVVSNYNGDSWSRETQSDFAKFVANGGGFVAVHAADNSFPEWPEYNAMIGVGGWGGRNEIRPHIRPQKESSSSTTPRATAAVTATSTSSRLKFARAITQCRATEKWMHADELYDAARRSQRDRSCNRLCGSQKRSGWDEPMLMVIEYEKGRVFHTSSATTKSR